MSEGIDTAAVIGSGVMGSAIAALFAGAGIRTYLLDQVPGNLGPAEQKDRRARNRLADAGLQKALAAKPAPFFSKDSARLIQTGNLEDDLERLRECDLVIEAIIEDLDIKQKLFQRVTPFLKSDAILATNTSGLSIAGMSKSLPPEVAKRFVVMHFFNP